MKKITIALVLAISLLFAAVSGTVSATVPEQSYGGEIVFLVGEHNSIYATGTVVYDRSYYNQLNAEQKNVYNSLVGLPPEDTTVFIDLLTPVIFTSINENPSYEEIEPLLDELYEIFEPSFNAFLRDNPIVFWLDLSGTIGSSSYIFHYNKYKANGLWNFRFHALEFNAVVAPRYSPNTQNFVTDVENAVSSFETQHTFRYDILKDIHDYLCKTVVYNLTALYAHEPYGALVDGKAVCEGYAEAFKLLCDRFAIPCVLILGTGVTGSGSEAHMWNYVQMEDGKWYAVDVTWDDQPSKIFYDFFLVGSQTVASSFGTKTFAQSHIESGYFSYESSFEFVYPPLNDTAYVPDPCRFGHTAGEWEIVTYPTLAEEGLRVKHCTVCGEILESEVIPKLPPSDALLKEGSHLSLEGGFLLGAVDNTTVLLLESEFEGEITITDSAGAAMQEGDRIGTGCVVDTGTITYAVVILGDVDGNGRITAVDYIMLKRAYLGTYILSEANLAAACIGGASFPTAQDYLKLRRHILGSYNIYAR